jgi:hypothetical protein
MNNKSTIDLNKTTADSRRRFLYIGIGLVIIFFITSSIITLMYLRQEATARAQRTTENLASSLQQTFDGMINTIDVALLSAVDEISRQRANKNVDPDSIRHLLERQAKRVPHLAFIRSTDQFGKVIYGVDQSRKTTYLDDREFFKRLRDDPNAGLVISEPVFAKIAQKWVWAFARRINHLDGSFAGVVYGSIYTDEIEKLFNQIHMAPLFNKATRFRSAAQQSHSRSKKH